MNRLLDGKKIVGKGDEKKVGIKKDIRQNGIQFTG
jgi:hypothetical protein